MLGGQFDRPPEFLTGFFKPIHVHQQFAQVQQRFGIARVLPKLHQIVLAAPIELSLAPISLGDPQMNLGMALIQIEGLLPAIQSLVEQPAIVQAQPHVVIAIGAFILVLPSGIEHLLGFFVIAQFSIGIDPRAVRRLERRIHPLDMLEGFQRFGVLAHPRKVGPQMIQRIDIIRLNLQRMAISIDRFIELLHFIERQSDIEKPPAVVRIDRNGRAKLFQSLRPFLLVEELFGPFDALLGIVPIVHTGTGWKVRVIADTSDADRRQRRRASEPRVDTLPIRLTASQVRCAFRESKSLNSVSPKVPMRRNC